MQIGDYESTSQFVTAGSGNARWCVANKNGKSYFLKQFLSPVQPVQTTESPTEVVRKRRMRCAAFERTKLALYNALSHIQDNCIVQIQDFFVHDGHYFTASEYVNPSFPTLQSIDAFPEKVTKRLLLSFAESLRMLHQHGIVHADLKPEHIIVDNRVGSFRIRIIDFDSGFLEVHPPQPKSNIEVDPVYLSPEAYRLIIGETVTLDRKLDTFAEGILLHQALTGEMPKFDKSRYAYLYAAVLDGKAISLSGKLDRRQHAVIRRMFSKNPAKRPGDEAICDMLKVTLQEKAL